MKLDYKRLGDLIQLVNIRNKELKNLELIGVTVNKKFIPSVANTIGTNMSNYKIIKKNQFACSLMQVRRDKKIPVALLEIEEAIISQAYPVFEVIDINIVLPQYLMMWMIRSEFDREACFYAIGGVRGSLEWDDFCDMQLPVPSIEKQKEIVKEYNIINDRIKLNEKTNQKLEETAQSIYKNWFVDFEFPDENGKPYKSSGGEMVYCDELDVDIPKGWSSLRIEEISSLKYGKMLDSNKFLDNGYPVFSGYGIRGYYSSYMYKEPQVLVLCRGVSGTGEVRLSPPQAYITNLSIVVEVNLIEMSKYFLFFYLKNKNLRTLDSGSAQSQITIGDLNQVLVLNPLNTVQERFEKYINSIELNINTNRKNKQLLVSLKEILLSKMATIEDEE